MAEYRLSNNTDLREAPVVLRNRRLAERLWRQIKPGPQAGNKYTAAYEVRCWTCGAWQDATVEYATCACAYS